MKQPCKNPNEKKTGWILCAGIMSLVVYLAWYILVPHRGLPVSPRMKRAAGIMAKAIDIIGEHCRASGIVIDRSIDPYQTGLIGPAESGMVTTKGNLEAKIMTTGPGMAGLIVYLLQQAGVRKGDTVAIGSSGSFPGLLVASLAAAQAMEIKPVVIISLGASAYGASRPGFNLLDMVFLLNKKGIFPVLPAAVSLGGTGDTGEEFDGEVKRQLLENIRLVAIPLIYEPEFRKNVLARMKIYSQGAAVRGGGKIAALINCGGAEPNIGLSSLVLKVKPGLNRDLLLPPEAERGVLFEMASENIPVIHLLYIKGLLQRYDFRLSLPDTP